MSVVPQAAHGDSSASLFGEHVISPHIESCQQALSSETSSLAEGHRFSEGTLADRHALAERDKPADAVSPARAVAEQTTPVKHAGPEAEKSPAKGKRRRVDSRKENRRHLHRVAEVRQQQGITERTMARRLGIDLKSYRRLEDPTQDLTLSQLMLLQEALEVPIGDLLVDHHALSRPTQERAKLLKVMKTAAALRDAKISPRADRMAHMLCEQLIDLMPELAEVSGWPQFGARRGISAIGKALQNPIDTSGLTIPD